MMRTMNNFVKANYQISRYALEAIGNNLSNSKNPDLKRRNALEITARNSKKLLEKLGVEVDVTKVRDDLFDRNYFMVCNHMSYFDILVLSSIRPSVFVTSVEMENTFFLGDLAKWGGSFFVDRVNRRKMKAEVEALVGLLEDDFNVFIFPEGTSTNGLEILPFKKSLFRVPFQTGFPILPICLRYQSIDGKPFSKENCDRIAWHGDMTFGPHFLQLMGIKNIKAEVHYLEPLDSKSFQNHGDLAKKAQEAISQRYWS